MKSLAHGRLAVFSDDRSPFPGANDKPPVRRPPRVRVSQRAIDKLS